MIANTVYAYCCEDISLIENYEKALNDRTQTWICHHKLGIEFSREELIANGLYFNRPARELIFLTKAEHKKLHNNSPCFKECRAKISAKCKGRLKSPEECAKISAALKGKPKSAEHIKKLWKAVYQIDQCTGEIINKWNSIKEASTSLNICLSQICNACRGRRKSACGFKWRYAD